MAIIWKRVRRWFVFAVKSESGLALIMVMSLIVVILAVIGEIIFQSEITSRAAVGERDRVRAEISANTGAQFATMLIMMDSAMGSLPPEVKALVSSQLGGFQFAKMLDGIPLGAEMFDPDNPLSAQVRDLFGSFDEDLMKALQAIPGYFVLKTTDESAKLNLNMLAQQQYKDVMKEQLIRLFSGEREARFLQDKGLDPNRLAANIVDYVDRNTTDELSGGDESSEYTRYKFTHKAKNAPLESLEELRRIPGFQDDEIFNVFSPYFTVWPMTPDEKSLNINTAPIELLAALSQPGTQEINDKNFDEIEDARAENESISDVRSVNEFIDTKLGATNANALKRISTVDSNVFKVEVRGVSNGVERVYMMVLARGKNKNVRDEAPVRLIYQRFL